MATPAPKTYQMLKTHFIAEYQLLNRMKYTTHAAGYHQMNFAAENTIDDIIDENTVSLQLNKAATQFAAANTQGQQTMAQLAATNAQLQHQVQELQKQTQMNMQMMMMAVTNNNNSNNSQCQSNCGGRGGGQGGRGNQQYLVPQQHPPMMPLSVGMQWQQPMQHQQMQPILIPSILMPLT
eukprot:8968922-Ditylum_brightwellii.AAC.1